MYVNIMQQVLHYVGKLDSFLCDKEKKWAQQINVYGLLSHIPTTH